MTGGIALVVALVVAIVGPLATYVTASRKLSGKIGTSEAGDLWAESRAMRDEYRERTAALEARVAKLEQANADLTRENDDLKRQLSDITRGSTSART